MTKISRSNTEQELYCLIMANFTLVTTGKCITKNNCNKEQCKNLFNTRNLKCASVAWLQECGKENSQSGFRKPDIEDNNGDKYCRYSFFTRNRLFCRTKQAEPTGRDEQSRNEKQSRYTKFPCENVCRCPEMIKSMPHFSYYQASPS